jgi:hypothetical protein
VRDRHAQWTACDTRSVVKTPQLLPSIPLSRIVNGFTRPVEIAGSIMAFGALVILALRAALRLELRWDTFMYHLPFAARRAGFHFAYEFQPYLQACYDGLPPLPEFLQGILWRSTGSIHATGVLNYLALGLFLLFAWTQLGARLWILVLLSLTAPLVLIHAASSYVDLFSNALLAIGVTSFLAMALFDRWMARGLLAWALCGMAGAAWSKYSTVPIVAMLFAGYLAVYGRRIANSRAKPGGELIAAAMARRRLALVLWALLVAGAPYLKNLLAYHNPTWPGGIPALKNYFPSLIDTRSMQKLQSPPPLKDSSHAALFFRSLFEINHPTSYPNRERWIIDQGNAWIAYRSGGFWVVGVITATLAAILLGFLSAPRHGFIIAAAIAALWCVVSVLPQSHELRYFQFLPLSVAAVVAMMIPRVRSNYPAASLAILILILGEFVWISKVNQAYYRVERVGYQQAAEAWGMEAIWKTLEPDRTYCAVGFEPAGFLLTGPTMREFHIIDRPETGLCPPGVTVLRRPQ